MSEARVAVPMTISVSDKWITYGEACCPYCMFLVHIPFGEENTGEPIGCAHYVEAKTHESGMLYAYFRWLDDSAQVAVE